MNNYIIEQRGEGLNKRVHCDWPNVSHIQGTATLKPEEGSEIDMIVTVYFKNHTYQSFDCTYPSGYPGILDRIQQYLLNHTSGSEYERDHI